MIQSMPKYVLPEGGRGSLGGASLAGGRHRRHHGGTHMNFAPYASRMGSSMENLGGFLGGGKDGDEDGNSSEEEGQLASRVFEGPRGSK